jgi:hypothetical protein
VDAHQTVSPSDDLLLQDELCAEMAQVNEAYQQMRDAVPSISISIDIDIDVDLPF